MHYSKLFTKTSRTDPKDEASKNAKLLIRAGFIHKEMAGVYAFLPLGLLVKEKIINIIREEMNALGAQEILMTNLQSPEVWKQTDRWDSKTVDVWFKTKLQNDKEVGLAWSHEEPITSMMKEFISSYRDLPVNVYQFQNKLRNELRAKSGIMRTREFTMKDLYSYSRNEEEHQKFYDAVADSYKSIFKRVGLGDITYLTFASGGAFTQFSHEFQTITVNGEDTVYLDREKQIAVNEEVFTDDVLKQLNLKKENLEKLNAAEVGNIFNFGTTKSKQLDLVFTDKDSTQKHVVLGSYGIGIGRLMGVIVEVFNDERGIIWPESIAPFQVHLISLDRNDESEKIYKELTGKKMDVLYDDRDGVTAGEKFADADLIGIPHRLVLSKKTGDKIEYKKRSEKETKLSDLNHIIENVENNSNSYRS